MNVDPIFMDGADRYQAPLPGTVGALHRGEPTKLPIDDDEWGGSVDLFRKTPPTPEARLVGMMWSAPQVRRSELSGRVLVTPESTITARHFDLSDDVIVDQHVRLRDGTGTALIQARTAWRVPTTSLPRADASTDEIATPAWGTILAERLAADPRFVSSTSTFDGSIGLASRTLAGGTAVEFRIYRGTIIETARKSLDGATYIIEADAVTWAELITGLHDDYVRLAAQGLFTVRGSGFQYLRMSKTVRIMIWHARELRRAAREEANHG